MICDDYVKLCKPGTCMAMQSKAWMTTSHYKKFLSFFKRFILSEIYLTNRHLLILDGHRSHVTFEAIEQVKEFGLDMITLPFHTSHAFQPLDAACFKPFKTTFKKERDITMVRRNYKKPNRITLARWVDKTLDLAITRKKSCQGSKLHGFGHLTLRPWIQNLALILYIHCKIQLRKKINQNRWMVNKTGQNIQL